MRPLEYTPSVSIKGSVSHCVYLVFDFLTTSNPVVAAYGTAHEIEFSRRVPTLEWWE